MVGSAEFLRVLGAEGVSEKRRGNVRGMWRARCAGAVHGLLYTTERRRYKEKETLDRVREAEKRPPERV